MRTTLNVFPLIQMWSSMLAKRLCWETKTSLQQSRITFNDCSFTFYSLLKYIHVSLEFKQPECRYSFHHLTEAARLSWLKHCQILLSRGEMQYWNNKHQSAVYNQRSSTSTTRCQQRPSADQWRRRCCHERLNPTCTWVSSPTTSLARDHRPAVTATPLVVLQTHTHMHADTHADTHADRDMQRHRDVNVNQVDVSQWHVTAAMHIKHTHTQTSYVSTAQFYHSTVPLISAISCSLSLSFQTDTQRVCSQDTASRTVLILSFLRHMWHYFTQCQSLQITERNEPEVDGIDNISMWT